MDTNSELRAYLKSTGLLLDKQLDHLQFELCHDELRIGRNKSNDLFIDIQTVSKKHAKITYENGQWFIEDLHSKNGIIINEYKIKSNQALNEGDTVSIGGVEFNFRLNKPEILLIQEIDQTLHLRSADLTSTLEQNKPIEYKKYTSELISFNKKTIIISLLLSMIIGYSFFKWGMVFNFFG